MGMCMLYTHGLITTCGPRVERILGIALHDSRVQLQWLYPQIHINALAEPQYIAPPPQGRRVIRIPYAHVELVPVVIAPQVPGDVNVQL